MPPGYYFVVIGNLKFDKYKLCFSLFISLSTTYYLKIEKKKTSKILFGNKL